MWHARFESGRKIWSEGELTWTTTTITINNHCTCLLRTGSCVENKTEPSCHSHFVVFFFSKNNMEPSDGRRRHSKTRDLHWNHETTGTTNDETHAPSPTNQLPQPHQHHSTTTTTMMEHRMTELFVLAGGGTKPFWNTNTTNNTTNITTTASTSTTHTNNRLTSD